MPKQVSTARTQRKKGLKEAKVNDRAPTTPVKGTLQEMKIKNLHDLYTVIEETIQEKLNVILQQLKDQEVRVNNISTENKVLNADFYKLSKEILVNKNNLTQTELENEIVILKERLKQAEECKEQQQHTQEKYEDKIRELRTERDCLKNQLAEAKVEIKDFKEMQKLASNCNSETNGDNEIRHRIYTGNYKNQNLNIKRKAPKSTLVIKPTDPNTTTKQLKSKLQNLEAAKHSQVQRVKILRDKIEVRLKTEDEKQRLKKIFQEDPEVGNDIIVHDKQSKMIRLIYFGIPGGTKPEDLMKSVGIEHLVRDESINSVFKPIQRQENRNKNLENWIVLVNRNIAFSQLQQQPFYYGLTPIRCSKYVKIMRCFNCQRLDHIARNCWLGKFCARCGDNHEESHCMRKNPTCINCADSNDYEKTEYNPRHEASDPNCPYYKDYKIRNQQKT